MSGIQHQGICIRRSELKSRKIVQLKYNTFSQIGRAQAVRKCNACQQFTIQKRHWLMPSSCM